MTQKTRSPIEKSPLRWTGVTFALAANLLLVTVAASALETLSLSAGLGLPILFGAALLAGILTALYARQRSGVHAFLGGIISIPLLAIFIFEGIWPPAVLAGAFCALGGVLMEIINRRR